VKRLIEPEDVADAVLWLCNPHSSHVTGASIAMDGGWTAS
jgi:3-hydroxybutyrate dehydrogenase